MARLAVSNRRDSRDAADALERCLALADEVDRSRAVHADLRNRLDRAERAAAVMRQAHQEIEAAYCRWDVRRGRVCGLHAIVRRALDGERMNDPRPDESFARLRWRAVEQARAVGKVR
jgi:hypothetical protein